MRGSPGPAAGRRACGSRRDCVDPPRRRRLRTQRWTLRRKAGRRNLVNAEHRDEVALLSGPAAAIDKYEDAPHGESTVRPPTGRAHPLSANVSDREMSDRPLGSAPRSDRLGDLMSAPPDLPHIVSARLRRVPPGRLRRVLPQRDRPPARDAGRDARRHDGRVRHRLRRRHGVAAQRRTQRGADPHRRARRVTGRRGREDLRGRRRRSRCWRPTGACCASTGRSPCSSSTPAAPRRSASTRSSTSSSRAASWCSTTSRPCESWPPITYGRVDTLREQWLTDERFTAVEVMVAADASAVIATRR